MKYGIEVYAITSIFWGFTAITNLVFTLAIYNLNTETGNIYVYSICLICIIGSLRVNYKFSETLDIKKMEAKGKIILAEKNINQ